VRVCFGESSEERGLSCLGDVSLCLAGFACNGEAEERSEAGAQAGPGEAGDGVQLPVLQPRQQRGVPHGPEEPNRGGVVPYLSGEIQHAHRFPQRPH
jgi:hypothetical protein